MSKTIQDTFDITRGQDDEIGEDEKRCPKCREPISKFHWATHIGDCDGDEAKGGEF